MKVTDHDVPDGRPVSVNATEGSTPKLAVTVPAAFTEAVVDSLVDERKVIEAVDDDHDVKM